MATEGDPVLQRRLLARAIARKFPAFDAVTYADYEQLFTVLRSRITGPFTLVIDEFPYLVRSEPSFASTLQRYLDERATGGFNLVVCGSSQQMMHDAVLSATAPLYGRADEIVKLEGLAARWLSVALPSLSAQEVITEYAVWGGIPRYWETRLRYGSLAEAVQASLLRSTGLYYDEARRLLQDDLRDLAQPVTVLNTIAQGVHRPAEIGARLGRKASELYRPLNRLVSLGYVEREVPFGESPRKSKSVHYRLRDPFLRFYYRFVLPNASSIGAGGSAELWEEIAEELPRFTSIIWEDLSRRAVLRGLTGPGITRAGRWWGKDTTGKQIEIDVIATDRQQRKWVAVECKWSRVGNPEHLRQELTEKVRRLPMYNGAPIETYVAAREGGETDDLVFSPGQVLG